MKNLLTVEVNQSLLLSATTSWLKSRKASKSKLSELIEAKQSSWWKIFREKKIFEEILTKSEDADSERSSTSPLPLQVDITYF